MIRRGIRNIQPYGKTQARLRLVLCRKFEGGLAQAASINALAFASQARTRTAQTEQNSMYWSRISKVAKVMIKLEKNSEIGTYVSTAQSRPTRGINAGESSIDKQDHQMTISRIADPYGLIDRWKTRTEAPSRELLVSNS